MTDDGQNGDEPNEAAVAAALEVMDRHIAGLNARDPAMVASSLHFPHYRLAGGVLKVWEGPEAYFDDFLARAGDGWHHSVWDFRRTIAAGPDKVHFDVCFTRYRADDTALGQFRSIWVIANLDGRWGAQLRSSFAS